MKEAVKPHFKDFFLYILIITVVVIGLIFLFSHKPSQSEEELKKPATNSLGISVKKYTTAPKTEINANKKYTATILTNKGSITVELFAKETPVAVNNFVFLAKDGFYNSLKFHRVIKDFMIQGGDPNGDGSGDPGYKFADEKITRDYKRGVLAMANSGPDTNGSQFFIMHRDYNLPKQYVIFGQVISGIETVDKIAQIPVVDNGMGEKSKPTEEIRIEKIEIKEN